MEEHGVSNYLCLGLKPVRSAAGVMGAQSPIPLLQGGKTWVSPDCTQSCICTMGSLQCSPFTCPSGSHCQFHDQDTAICKPDSKARPRGHGPPTTEPAACLFYLPKSGPSWGPSKLGIGGVPLIICTWGRKVPELA